MSIVFGQEPSINFGYLSNKLILHLSGNHNNRHKGTLIYNLVCLNIECIYSSASAQPLLGLIELKTQGTLYIYNLILSHIFHPKISIGIRRNCINHWYKTRDCLYMLFWHMSSGTYNSATGTRHFVASVNSDSYFAYAMVLLSAKTQLKLSGHFVSYST